MADKGDLPRVAFLGPLGTYSFQAAYDRFGEAATYCEQRTITDVFNALSSVTPIAIVPQENSIFGSVTETYDLLRSPVVGKDKFVRGEISIAVHHCLLVRHGVKIHEITHIISHEQALGQCRRFIKCNIPNASLESTSSTAAAAKAVLSADPSTKCAAICSKICATVFAGLEVLREGIQDENVNATRFYILTIDDSIQLPSSSNTSPNRALVRMGTDPAQPTGNVNITQLLYKLGLCALRIERRPSLHPTVFHDIYFVELQQEISPESAASEKEGWIKEVEEAVERVKVFAGEADLLGTWRP